MVKTQAEINSVAGVWRAWTEAKIGLGGLYATGTVWTLEWRQDREGLDRFPRRQDRDGLDTERRQDREGWDSSGHRTGTVWAVERRQDRERLDSNVATCRCIGMVWTKVETDWDGLDK